MKAVCVVAHPDDCIIFAYAFIHNHPEYHWDIVYVTNDEDSPRGQEIKQFWNKRGISTHFLEYEDNVDDHWKNHSISFDTVDACNKIEEAVRGLELLPSINQEPKYHEYPDLREIIIK